MEQMHLMKCHFHEFCSPIQMWRQKKWKKLGEKQFTRNWISFYYLMQPMFIKHFNYLGGVFGRGSTERKCGRETIGSKTQIKSSSNLRNTTTNAFYCGSQFPPPTIFFQCFEFQSRKANLRRRNLIQIWTRDNEPSTSSRPAWQNSSRMK